MDPAPLRLVCLEPRFPGRLGATADWLVRRRGYRCQFYCHRVDPEVFWPASVTRGLDVIPFAVGGVAREPATDWTRLLERGLCYAFSSWEALTARGPAPFDLVLGRSAGLGSTLFAPLYRSGVPIVNFFDYYLPPTSGDLADEDAAALPPTYRFWRRSANAMDLLDLENGVRPWAPTAWQRDTYPPEYRDDFLVLFDGIDARRFRRPPARPRVIAGRSVPDDTKLVTFVSGCTDRMRGFDRFINLMNRLVRAGENVLGVAVGAPVVSDGLDVRFFNKDFRERTLTQDPPPDKDRLLFLNRVPHSVVAEVLGASDLHVYPSRSGPVSRSLLEALSAECVVLAADTAPVREVVTAGRTGLLVPPGNPDAWESQARRVLGDLAGHRVLGTAGGTHVRTSYAQDATLPRLAESFEHLVFGGSGRRRWSAPTAPPDPGVANG